MTPAEYDNRSHGDVIGETIEDITKEVITKKDMTKEDTTNCRQAQNKLTARRVSQENRLMLSETRLDHKTGIEVSRFHHQFR